MKPHAHSISTHGTSTHTRAHDNLTMAPKATTGSLGTVAWSRWHDAGVKPPFGTRLGVICTILHTCSERLIYCTGGLHSGSGAVQGMLSSYNSYGNRPRT